MTDADPFNRAGQLRDVRIGLFPDRSDHHLYALRARAFEYKEGKTSIACNQTVLHFSDPELFLGLISRLVGSVPRTDSRKAPYTSCELLNTPGSSAPIFLKIWVILSL